MAATTLDISTISLAASSYLLDAEGMTWTIGTETVRNDSLTDDMESEQVQKITHSLDIPLMSSLTNPDRVSDLNMTAATLGGDNLLTTGLSSLDLDISYARADRPSAGSMFKHPQNVKRRLTGRVEFAVPDSGDIPLVTAVGSTTHADKVLSLSFTINAITFTLPVLLTNVVTSADRDGLIMISADLGPRKPVGGGAYPSAPVGTSSLLEKAINDYRTPIAVVVATKAVGGRSGTGNFIFDSVKLEARDGGLVMVRYGLINQGTVTVATTV